MKKEKKKPEIDSIVASRRQRIHGFSQYKQNKTYRGCKIKLKKTFLSFLYCTVHTWKGGADGHWGRK